jgi:hypothetical protein
LTEPVNIGNALGGLPYSRLYVFQPGGARFEQGTFRDIGGTAAVPDFGGFAHDSNKDKAGPDINVVDLDNDGDLDLLQSYHVDCREPDLPYSPCEYRQGTFAWRNMLAEKGELRFEPAMNTGIAEVGKLRYNRAKGVYDTERVGAGLPYVSLGDVNNDSLVDVVAVGPSDPGWSPRADPVGGRFWYNLGGSGSDARPRMWDSRRSTGATASGTSSSMFRRLDRVYSLPASHPRRSQDCRDPIRSTIGPIMPTQHLPISTTTAGWISWYPIAAGSRGSKFGHSCS